MRAIARVAALALLLLVVPAIAQSDPGWILPKPYSVNDAVNANAIKCTGVWLINYSPLNSVIVTNIVSSQPWLTIPWSGGVINIQDSVFVPIVLNGAGITGGQTLSGQITIIHNGVNSPKVISVAMYVSTSPAIGPQIAVLPQFLNISLEQHVNGELKLQISNFGDMPLQVMHCFTTSSLFTPMIDTAHNVTPITPAQLVFNVNTNGLYDYQIISDTIRILSNAINAPTYMVPITVHVLPDSSGGVSRTGDVNWDGYCDVLDVYYMIGYLKGANTIPPCWPASDINGNGVFNGLDITALIAYLKGYGNAPAYACSEPVSNLAVHLPNRQIEIGYLKGHRGEWVSSPVKVQALNYYGMQGAMSLPNGLIDSAKAINISSDSRLKPAIVTFDDLRPGYKSLILQEEDNTMTRTPLSLSGPTSLYNMKLHIPFGSLTGSFPIIPDDISDRGSSKLSPSYGNMIEAPLFMGSYLTIIPRVSMNHFTGIGDIVYVHDSTTLVPSLTISSDGYVMGNVYIAIMASGSGTVIYTDTLLSWPLAMGINHIVFSRPWVIRNTEQYVAAAGVIVNGDDYSLDNYTGKPVSITSYNTIGLPPNEGFEEPLRATFPPTGWMVINRGGPNTWERTGLKARGGTRSSAVLSQAGEDQNEWFVKGPMNWSTVNDPAVIFYEAQDDWSLYGYRHEYYISIGDTFNADEATLIAANTPGDHSILSYFSDDSVEISLTEYAHQDKVWFAFRYVKNPTEYGSDSWFIDDVTWVDRSAPPTSFEYVMGDANFASLFNQQNGHPVFSGSDVTYGVRYLKGLNPGCFFTRQITPESTFSLYAMLDVNGDCKALGGDIIRMVNYFKGLIPLDSLKPCPVFTPIITPVVEHYPPCTIPPTLVRIIPSHQATTNGNENREAILKQKKH